MTVEDAIRTEHQRQATLQASVANTIPASDSARPTTGVAISRA
jgi:hypothetical protein